MSKFTSTSHPILGNILCLIAAICWGVNVPANKVDIPQWISPGNMAIVRIVGMCVLVWVLSLFVHRKPFLLSDRKYLFYGGIAMFGFIYVFSLAFTTASPIDVSIILTFQPLLVVLINAVFRKQRLKMLEIAGMIIAFAGALMIILMGAKGENGSGRLIGDLWAIGSAICYSSYLVIIEPISVRYHPVHIMKWIVLIALVITVPLIFIYHPLSSLIFHAQPGLPLLCLLFIVLICTCFGYLTEPWAIKMVGSDIVAMYQYLVPVVAAIVAIVLGVGTFHWYQPVAFVIISAGVLMANVSMTRAKKAKITQKAG